MTDVTEIARKTRIGYAAFGWAVAYGAFGLVSALTGTAVFYRATEPLPVSLNCGRRHGRRPGDGRHPGRCTDPRPAVRVALIGLCVLSGAAAFGLLMDVITLAVNQTVDSWTATANRALATVGVVLLVATARSLHARPRPRCGTVHTSATARRIAVSRQPPRRTGRAPTSTRMIW